MRSSLSNLSYAVVLVASIFVLVFILTTCRKAHSIYLTAKGFKAKPTGVDESRNWLTLIECPDGSTRYCLFKMEPPEHFVILPGDGSFVPVYVSSLEPREERPELAASLSKTGPDSDRKIEAS